MPAETMFSNALTVFGLNPYLVTLDNCVNRLYNRYTIDPSVRLSYDPEKMDNWTWFWSVCLSRYRESDTGQVVGWVLTGVVLAGLTIATILTFGTSAPISGTAATLVVGATKGAWATAIVNYGFQFTFKGFENINSWEVLTSTIVGGVTGAAGGWMEHSLKGINQTLGGKIGMSLATSYLGTVLEAGLTMESLTALSFINATITGGLDGYISYNYQLDILINFIIEVIDNVLGLLE